MYFISQHFKTCHYYLNRLGYNYINENEKVDIINNNCISIANDSKIIINLSQVMNDKHFFDLRNLFLNISRITEQDIYNYFYTSLSLDDNTINSQVLIQKEKEDDKKFLENIIFSYKLNKVIPPFLDYKSKKIYRCFRFRRYFIKYKISRKWKISIKFKTWLNIIFIRNKTLL